MHFIEQMAALVGLSPGLFIALIASGMILLGGWVILKTALKIAWKTFTTGCLLMLLLIGGLYIGSLLLANLP